MKVAMYTGCGGTGVVAVHGPLALCGGFSGDAAVRELCTCGECNGVGFRPVESSSAGASPVAGAETHGLGSGAGRSSAGGR